MASKKKADKVLKRRRRIIGALFFCVFACALVFLAYSFALSRVVRVRRATLRLPDLPAEFAGTKILFASDIDIVGLSTPGGADRLFESLEYLGADMLVLGGDYASTSLIDSINGADSSAKLSENRREFFAGLADFDAPLGKFAVCGDNDDPTTLAAEASLGGVTLLRGETHAIYRGSRRLLITGLDSTSSDPGALAAQTVSGDCVIVVAHDPAAVPQILTAEPQGGGAWADAILSGHTHAGQIAFGDKRALTMSARQEEYLYGWKNLNGVYQLTTSGVGCESINLRFGTSAEVWLITLEPSQ